jgi:hypothetical protein
MSDSIIPVTQFATSFTGVLPIATVGKGVVKQESWQQTTYPNGATVTRIYHNSIEVYDNRAVVTRHNEPNIIDILIK